MKTRLKFDLSKLVLLFSDIYFLLTIGVCIILIIFKYSDFSLPYFSDELWVYGPSVRKMGILGPSMLPNSLSIEDHWAHPLLFFFTGGTWCLIFGSSILSTHIFAASISITLLISIYFIGKNIFSKEVGFYTVLIFSTQSIFLGQFSLVLPEVMLTLFAFLTIYFYYKKKILWYLFFGICLVLTKETGIFPILAIVLWNLFKDLFYEKENPFKLSFIKKNSLLISPLLVLGIHFALLKVSYGWFLLPDRVEAFEFNWEIYHERIMHTFHYVFINQGRKPIIILLFIAAILFNKKHSIWLRVLIFLIGFSIIKIFFEYWKLPDVFELTIIPILFIVLLKYIFWDIYKMNKKQGDVLGVFSIFIVIYLLFSSAQFDSLRYLYCTIPVFIMISIYFVQSISTTKKIILPILSLIIIYFSIQYISKDTNTGDDTNNYSDMCLIRIKSVQFLETNNYYLFPIKAPFLFNHAIRRPLTGYLSSNKNFNNLAHVDENTVNCAECICIFENTSPSLYYNDIAQNINFELINKTEKGSVWIEIYKKIKQ